MGKNTLYYAGAFLIVLITIVTCTPKPYFFRSNYEEVNGLIHQTKNLQEQVFLKAHMKNGEVYILRDTWEVDTIQDLVKGYGSNYDFNRNKLSEGTFLVHIDSVAIFETNKILDGTESKRITALTILAGVDVAIGAVCLMNPKACFGSCPTFYIDEEDNFHYADAEGFSNAIAPSLEYFDIDALNNQHVTRNSFSILMKNEALETHVINNIKLFAFPRKPGERVYQSPDNRFYSCENIYLLSQSNSTEGDNTALLKHADRQERFSLADEQNLSSKEEIYLSFDNIRDSKDLGILISFRQSLMTTYFIYSAMGYMGDEVGDIFAMLETDKKAKKKLQNGIYKELGDIDVYSWNESNQNWDLQGGFYETGPIAYNRQILPLSVSGNYNSLRLKIVLNRGLWRLDNFALTNIRKKNEPIVIDPWEVQKNGIPDVAARKAINADDRYLISVPGSEYRFNFELPAENEDYELFLYSKGYYLEWMRETWIKDKDLLKLKQMIDSPKRYLFLEAKAYKEYEKTMEQQFWESKIDTKNFSHYGT